MQNSRHTARDKGLSERRQRVRENKSYWAHVREDRAVGVAWWRNGRGWGIIELQWPSDSTIGEVMCWINSVPDPVFGRAVPLVYPRDPKAREWRDIFLRVLLPAKSFIQIDRRAQRPMELRCMHCTLIFSAHAKALYTLGHALEGEIFLFAWNPPKTPNLNRICILFWICMNPQLEWQSGSAYLSLNIKESKNKSWICLFIQILSKIIQVLPWVVPFHIMSWIR